MTTIQSLKAQLENLNGCQFVSFVYQSMESGEIARHTVNIGANYLTAMEKDLLALQLELPALKALPMGETPAQNADKAVTVKACEELIASFEERIAAHKRGEVSENYTCKDTYVNICKGLKLGTLKDGTIALYVYGYRQAKVVLVQGEHKETKSRPLTIAKRQLEKRLNLSSPKYKQFALRADVVKVKINGETLDLTAD